jgi:phosphate transport system protein
MWKDLWNIIRQGDTLLDEARAECIEMLDLARKMFEVVLEATVEEADANLRNDIREQDKVLNQKQQEIRRKVFEHLAVSKGSGLLSGLVLTSVVIDLERIGDYTKNVGEVVTWMPGAVDFGEYKDLYLSIVERTRKLFAKTRAAFVDHDQDAAREHVEFYQGISHDSDGLLKSIMESGAPDETVEKRIVALVMLLRYMKRVAAHLKNICTAVANPFPMIGFRPEGME